jgi:hypothetical protein
MAKPDELRAARGRRRAEILVLMRGLARRYKNLVTRIGKAEMNASFIEYELFQLIKSLEEFLEQDDESSIENNLTQPNATKPLRYLAETGASSLVITSRPDGNAEIRIDGGKRFTLPPTLADLLSALAIDNGAGDDVIVGWKTLKEIGEYLAKQTGSPVSKRAITQNVYRLRKELFDRGGVNPYLVQTNRRRGLRFALRRKTGPVIGGGR